MSAGLVILIIVSTLFVGLGVFSSLLIKSLATKTSLQGFSLAYVNSILSILKIVNIVSPSLYDSITNQISNKEKEKKEDEPTDSSSNISSSSSIVAKDSSDNSISERSSDKQLLQNDLEEEKREEERRKKEEEEEKKRKEEEERKRKEEEEEKKRKEEEEKKRKEEEEKKRKEEEERKKEEEKKKKQLEKMLEHRSHILQEILSTEETYVRQLSVFIDRFLHPIRAKQNDLGLSKDDMTVIFSNFEMIRVVNSGILEKLRKCINEDKGETIGKVLKEMLKMFQCYNLYFSNFTASQDRLKKIRTPPNSSKYSKFLKFLKEAQEDDECQGYTIDAFLILPVQRIPRYRLLLQELLKYTPSDHSDRPDISSALEKMKELVGLANSASRTTEQRMNVLTLVKRLEEGKKNREKLMKKEWGEKAGGKEEKEEEDNKGVEFVDANTMVTPTRRLLMEMNCVVFCDPFAPSYAPIVHFLPHNDKNNKTEGKGGGLTEKRVGENYAMKKSIAKEASLAGKTMDKDQLRRFAFAFLAPSLPLSSSHKLKRRGTGKSGEDDEEDEEDDNMGSKTVSKLPSAPLPPPSSVTFSPSSDKLAFSEFTLLEPTNQPSSVILFNDSICVCYAADSPYFPLSAAVTPSTPSSSPLPPTAISSLPTFLSFLEDSNPYSSKSAPQDCSLFSLSSSTPLSNVRSMGVQPLILGELVPFHNILSYSFSDCLNEKDEVIEGGKAEIGTSFSSFITSSDDDLNKYNSTTSNSSPTHSSNPSSDALSSPSSDIIIPQTTTVHSLVLNQLLLLKKCAQLKDNQAKEKAKKSDSLLEYDILQQPSSSKEKEDAVAEMEEAKSVKREGIAYQAFSISISIDPEWSGLSNDDIFNINNTNNSPSGPLTFQVNQPPNPPEPLVNSSEASSASSSPSLLPPLLSPSSSHNSIVCQRVYLLRGTVTRLSEFKALFEEAMEDLKDSRTITAHSHTMTVPSSFNHSRSPSPSPPLPSPPSQNLKGKFEGFEAAKGGAMGIGNKPQPRTSNNVLLRSYSVYKS